MRRLAASLHSLNQFGGWRGAGFQPFS